MPETSRKLLTIFQAEHAEHVRRIRSLLASSEQAGETLQLDEIFRRAHTLKGAARAVELKPVEAVAHGLEALFARVREGTLGFDRNVSGVIRRALDFSEDFMEALAAGKEADSDRAVQTIGQLLAWQGSPDCVSEERLVEAGRQTVWNYSSAAPFPPEHTVRLDREALDRFDRAVWRFSAELFSLDDSTAQIAELEERARDMERESDRVRTAMKKLERSGQKNLQPVIRYFQFMDGALRTLVPRARTAHKLQRRKAWALQSSCRSLQTDLLAARMVPAEVVYEGFHKIARDLARGEGKQVQFRMLGGALLADRMVLQALRDPLMHLVRNAIDHGIELPEERLRKGKPAAGSLTLRISSQQHRLRIALEDDGRGLDFEEIRKAALRRGLATEAELAACSLPDLTRLIFEPGFSTATEVTNLSGRGMGLSVVYEAVRLLQGEVEWDAASGTTLIISVPLKALSSRLLLVRCGAGLYALPTHGIARVMRVRRPAEGCPRVMVEGRETPVVPLAKVLGLAPAAPRVNGSVFVVALQSGVRRAAVEVDEVLSEREGMIQNLGVPPGRFSNKVAGATLLPNGAIAIVLNPSALVEACAVSPGPGGRLPEPPGSRADCILVADDSPTTQLLQKNILESSGYQVRLAADGAEALEAIRADPPALVITDLEMPKLSGLALLEEMKGDKNLSRIPVIIVSSVEKVEDKARAIALSVGAFIDKENLSSVELLETIRRIL